MYGNANLLSRVFRDSDKQIMLEETVLDQTRPMDNEFGSK